MILEYFHILANENQLIKLLQSRRSSNPFGKVLNLESLGLAVTPD